MKTNKIRVVLSLNNIGAMKRIDSLLLQKSHNGLSSNYPKIWRLSGGPNDETIRTGDTECTQGGTDCTDDQLVTDTFSDSVETDLGKDNCVVSTETISGVQKRHF
ncbi:MAG: hypothetical protein IPM74_02245 [Crocinitomicaceae bacterium]|nr:hypothetical protein [Crocinitomicaceae bacterium]MBK8924737.1 hypothetical protein [Crocinitomicaceae bacterium]